MDMINNRRSLLDIEEPHFEELFRLKSFPVKMGVTETSQDQDIYADMIFMIEKETGMVQLKELVPQDVLYSDAHYNNVASSWKEHHQAFAGLIADYKPCNVFEIGGGTGLLSKFYTDRVPEVKWTILEASPNPVVGCKANYIKGIFDESYKIPQGYDAVVHTHTMEHFYHPMDSIRAISDSLGEGGHMFLSIPNLEKMYRRSYTNVMNFEHAFLCIEPYVSEILAENGFLVKERTLFKEEHSVFYVAEKVNGITARRIDYSCCYEKHKMMIQNWALYHKRLADKINTKLENISGDRDVFLFGAHVYAQFLLGFGVGQKRIRAVLDNDGSKQGKRLYGTKYQVYSPEILRKLKAPLVILHAGTHDEEIKKGILLINQNAEFI